MRRPIQVTHPTLASLQEVLPYFEEIWNEGMLTNDGPLVQRFESELARRLGVAHVVCVNSGTMALQLCTRALELQGEIITTPFTFIGTANAIQWEGCEPVYADIDAQTWNLDPAKIEGKISSRTSAILPVHVFGNPCDTVAIQQIAEKHGLEIFYDAAHATSVNKDGRSLLINGRVSVLSFHATKVLNTAEGGACVTEEAELAERLRALRFFGFDQDKTVRGLGINAKMSEISAALGLANLALLDSALATRRNKYLLYQELLAPCTSIHFQQFSNSEYNYTYMPILLDEPQQVTAVMNKLEEQKVFPRRYFYPALHQVEGLESGDSLPVAEDISSRILCLPLYDQLADEDIRLICRLILECA